MSNRVQRLSDYQTWAGAALIFLVALASIATVARGDQLAVTPSRTFDFDDPKISFSNRFAGPLRRLLVAMRQLADGQPVRPIQFRSRDYYRDFAHEFNRILARVQTEKDESSGLASQSDVDRRPAPTPE